MAVVWEESRGHVVPCMSEAASEGVLFFPGGKGNATDTGSEGTC